MTDPVIGSILGGKYLVEGVLGQGGMGVVVAARHRELDQRVAIKCLLAHTQSVPEIVERFMREARAAAKIQGEHVARVIDVGRFDDGTPFMVMEYLQGRDLATELHYRGALPVSDCVRYVLQTCEALVQAHALRIVHRDLKPSNLFLAEQPGREPIIKVLDFGISKVIEPGGAVLTNTANMMGTPYYMSPEQLLSARSVDERSDIWALGVILYELLVGEPPFTGESAPAIIAQVLRNTPDPVRARRPDISPGLEAAIERCMRTKVEERYANVADLAQALMPFAARPDRESALAIARVLGRPSPEGFSDPPRPAAPVRATATAVLGAAQPTAHNLSVSADGVGPPRSRRSLFVGVGAVVAVAAAVGVVAVVRPMHASSPPTVSATTTVVATDPPAPLPPPVALTPVEPPAASVSAAVSAQHPAPDVPPPGARPPGHHAPPAIVASTAPAAAPTPARPPENPPAATAASPARPAPQPANPLDMHIK